MRNKFEVGEVVILQSEDRPELNGEYTIRHVIYYGDAFYDRLAKKKLKRMPSNYVDGVAAYNFEEIIKSPSGEGVEACWMESALRKKHIGGDMSYDQLVNSLKTGQPA